MSNPLSTNPFCSVPTTTHRPTMPQIELLPTTTNPSVPGWAYVLDRGLDPSRTALAPTTGRRPRTLLPAAAASEQLSTRQQAALTRRLHDLDRDGTGREVEVPAKWKARTGGVVRRILLSEKGWSHHLADEEARIAALAGGAPPPVESGKRRVRSGISSGVGTPGGPVGSGTGAGTGELEEGLTAQEVERLLAVPALSFSAARAGPPGERAARTFCEICGYWGRARCLKCGARVCGLECKEQHDVECRRKFA
ncbi:hypothetical protein EJ06DRAFT_530735 [Trichodelitschia bisporula]|uniref:HIT-type domain-containing protein n=1 Tax=Trichodelitschia bisporula TaxID=703511 RepID=A0A6G1HVC0_9PEZI|nr:hypothetical protein EJ06DRAFT_530735 [Trichodelitschia bisporula]